MTWSGSVWMLGAVAVLAACTEKHADEDRTLQKLKAEAAREQQARPAPASALGDGVPQTPGAAQTVEGEALLKVVADASGKTDFSPRSLPGALKPLALGPLVAELKAASAGQTVATGRVSLSTAERFLRLELRVFNGSTSPQPLELDRARLTAGDQPIELARDAQSAAGTRALHLQLQPHEDRAVTLFFEVPPAALSRQLALQLPAPDGTSGTLTF